MQHLADNIHLTRDEHLTQDEESFLRYRVKRLRTILRFAHDPRAIAGLQEVIEESESRLAALECRPQLPPR